MDTCFYSLEFINRLKSTKLCNLIERLPFPNHLLSSSLVILSLPFCTSPQSMACFLIDQTSREALTEERAKQLLEGLHHQIKSVKLSGKSFGDGSAQVAADALQKAIPSLKHLDISDIIASRPEEEAKRTLVTISEALSSCKHLEFIDLSDNALGAKGIRAVGSLLAGQKNLATLMLCNNGLAADAGNLIAAAFLETAPTSLIKLHFHNNLLETPGSVALAPVVENSPFLSDFRFSSLRLGRDGAVRISRALQPRLSSTLKYLNISDNSFGEEGAEAFAEALSNAPLLERLIINDALLGDEGVKAICLTLAKSAPNLQVLNVSGNDMAVEGAKGLAKLLAVGTLKEFFAEDNELGSSGAVRIARGINAKSQLQVLNVNSSEIGGRGALALASAASKVATLKSFNIDGNNIPADIVSEIERLLNDKLGSLEDNDDDSDADDESEHESEDNDSEEEVDEVESCENGVILDNTSIEKVNDKEEVDELSSQLENIGI